MSNLDWSGFYYRNKCLSNLYRTHSWVYAFNWFQSTHSFWAGLACLISLQDRLACWIDWSSLVRLSNSQHSHCSTAISDDNQTCSFESCSINPIHNHEIADICFSIARSSFCSLTNALYVVNRSKGRSEFDRYRWSVSSFQILTHFVHSRCPN